MVEKQMKNHVIILLTLLMLSCQSGLFYTEAEGGELSDKDPSTAFIGNEGTNRIIFKDQFKTPIQSYSIYSSGASSDYDPANWTLKGSYDGKEWILLDEQEDQKFCARYQEILCHVNKPSNYQQYILEIETLTQDTLKIGDVLFHQENLWSDWDGFKLPKVDFQIIDESEGSRLYGKLVQDPEAFIQYHVKKVAHILYSSPSESIPRIDKIDYHLCDYDGISSKSGQPPVISIQYSTRYIEEIGKQCLYALDQETRGILYHVLAFGYQHEPKGIGTYETNQEYRACVEGLAYLVRAQTGSVGNVKRRPGGHWLDGQQITGYFLCWLISKQPDMARQFNQTIKDLEVWSFDAAIKQIFGSQASIENYWNEYQIDINKLQLKELV